MLIITDDISRIDEEGWDYPLEELDYLLKERDETFVLHNGRLYEAKYPNDTKID